jgi:hypothetical protein
MMNGVLVTLFALIGGVIGGLGYSHFLGPQAGEPLHSQSKTDPVSGTKSSPIKAAPGSGTDAARNASATAPPAQETDELKQQIISLSKRIDRLGERVDRLQELLSLAVPLMQRLAPKH